MTTCDSGDGFAILLRAYDTVKRDKTRTLRCRRDTCSMLWRAALSEACGSASSAASSLSFHEKVAALHALLKQ